MEYSMADAHTLPRVVALLDSEFITARKRKISVARRFPALFAQHGYFHLALNEQDVASVVVARPFRWNAAGEALKGAMIGMVCTRPDCRGRGIASRLLQQTQQTLGKSGFDFAVLWTIRAAFYQRLGWISEDCSVFSEADLNASAAPREVVARPPSKTAWCEALRQKIGDGFVAREAADYQKLPLPAESVEHYAAGTQAYALVGNASGIGFLYEMIGDAGKFGELWHAIARNFRKLFINDRHGSASHRWLAQNAGIVWMPQRLAMWLPLSRRASRETFRGSHIPYFDRI